MRHLRQLLSLLLPRSFSHSWRVCCSVGWGPVQETAHPASWHPKLRVQALHLSRLQRQLVCILLLLLLWWRRQRAGVRCCLWCSAGSDARREGMLHATRRQGAGRADSLRLQPRDALRRQLCTARSASGAPHIKTLRGQSCA